MPLLEVIVTPETTLEVIATCVSLGKAQRKTVIVVHDGPGFYTSRILAPYLNEAAWMLAGGVAVERIDQALVAFGFPVGPFMLLDEVGLDVAAKVGTVLFRAFGPRLAAPDAMQALRDDDRQGRKNGRGFYQYGAASSWRKSPDRSVYRVLGIDPKTEVDAAEITQRCVLQMVNEAALCFGEGILRSARDGDVGAVFGLGFPPFLGGPFRYVDAQSAAQVCGHLQHYAALHGERFAPAPVLCAQAETGATFYGQTPSRPGEHG